MRGAQMTFFGTTAGTVAAACLTAALLVVMASPTGHMTKSATPANTYAMAISAGPGLALTANAGEQAADGNFGRRLVCRHVIDLVFARIGTRCAHAETRAAFAPRID